jgi:hypothetical protein
LRAQGIRLQRIKPGARVLGDHATRAPANAALKIKGCKVRAVLEQDHHVYSGRLATNRQLRAIYDVSDFRPGDAMLVINPHLLAPKPG